MKLNTHNLLLIAVLGATTPLFARDDEHDHAPKSPSTAHDNHEHAHDAKDEAEHADEVKLTADAIRQNGIKIDQAKRQTLSDTLVVSARLDFNREEMAHVGAAVRGRVVQIKAKVGDEVRNGDELLVIESPELGEAQSDFLQKRTSVKVAEATVEPLKVSYERGKALYDKNQGIALAEVQKREAEYRAAVGAVETSKAAVAAAENRLRLFGMGQAAIADLTKSSEIQPRYVVHAPMAGRVIQREVTLGELVTPEKEALLVLANMDRLWMLADVPEARLGDVAAGAVARITLAAIPEKHWTGTVAQVSPSIDPATRTARVRIELPNENGTLRPGMFGKAEIAVGGRQATTTLVVPDDAVQTVEGKPAVFVPVDGEENTFAKREVSIGEPVGGMVPIVGGLTEGEPYVITGSFILKAELGKGSAAHEH